MQVPVRFARGSQGCHISLLIPPCYQSKMIPEKVRTGGLEPPYSSSQSEIELRPETALLQPSLLWLPDWVSHDQWLEALPFVFLVTDLLQPRDVAVVGESMRSVFYAACQAAERSQVAARVRLFTEYDELPTVIDAERVRCERWQGFSEVIRGGAIAALTALRTGGTDLLCLGRSETDRMDLDVTSALRDLITGSTALLLEDPGAARALIDTPDKAYKSFTLNLAKGPVVISPVASDAPRIALQHLLSQLHDEPQSEFLFRGVLTRLGAGLREASEARIGWRTADRHEAELARMAGALDLARGDVAALQVSAEDAQRVRTANGALEATLSDLKGEIARQQGEFERQQDAIAQHRSEIARLQGEIARHRSEIARQRSEIERQQDEIAQRETQNHHAMESLRSACEAKNKALVSGQEELVTARAELSAIVSSTSWRLTGPVRLVMSRRVRSSRLLRRCLKLFWWTATLQLATRYIAWRATRRRSLEPPDAASQSMTPCRSAVLEAIPEGFDELAYLAAHDDVRRAVAAGQLTSGLAHYLSAGRQEGRPLTVDEAALEGFDELAYLAAHDDVRRAVAAGQLTSGLAHYLSAGRQEGRPLTLAAMFHERIDRIQVSLNGLGGLLDFERSRTDWALGAVEGVTSDIDSYHALRRQPEYLAAFEKPEPLVSVCVATVNRSALLVERAISSLLAQTYRNLQIVVVGDHCTDDTAQRLAELGDSRISFVNLPERGPYPRPGADRWYVAGSNAMNHALSLCKGDFVTHLDDDDAATTDRIETLLTAAQQNFADFLWHRFWCENRDGTWMLLGDGRFEAGKITTGSIFYHRYFTKYPWNVHAYRLNEPGDWNRLRKIKVLRPNLHFVDRPLLFHYAEQSQPLFVARDAERFLD